MAALKADIDRILNQARVELPGASDAGLKASLFEVFTDFFDWSDCWRESIPFPVTQGITQYAISTSEGQIIRLLGVLDANGFPQPAVLSLPDPTLVLQNPPNQVQAPLQFSAVVSKNVVLPNNRDEFPIVPTFVLARYPTAIIAGLKAKMMLQKGKPYSDPAMARVHWASFNNGWVQAKTDAYRSNTVGAQNWRFPQQFRTTTQRGGISVPGDIGFS